MGILRDKIIDADPDATLLVYFLYHLSRELVEDITNNGINYRSNQKLLNEVRKILTQLNSNPDKDEYDGISVIELCSYIGRVLNKNDDQRLILYES